MYGDVLEGPALQKFLGYEPTIDQFYLKHAAEAIRCSEGEVIKELRSLDREEPLSFTMKRVLELLEASENARNQIVYMDKPVTPRDVVE